MYSAKINTGWHVVVAALLLACVLGLAGCGSAKVGNSDSTSSQSSAASDSVSSISDESADSVPSSSVSESTSSSGSASRDSVKIDNVVLDQDAIGRYFISATLENSGVEKLDVKFEAKVNLTERKTNKYDEDEEYTSIEKVSGCDSPTPWVMGGKTISVLGLERGEKREVTIYPTSIDGGSISSQDCTISDPQLTVSGVTLTSEASKLSDVPDFDGELEVEIISFDGKKVSGTVTNNTGKYLNSADLFFVKYDTNKLPVTDKPWSGKRPVGADIVKETVKNLKPGAVAEFDVRLGDCDDAEVKNVYYNVDQAKS